jgi:hypothetical protein
MTISRRIFVLGLIGSTGSLVLPEMSRADQGMVSESDSNALALGYKADATQVDKAKYKNYVAGQTCSDCQFFQGAANAPSAPCPLFGGKTVDAKGWCSGYAKRG